MTEQNMDYGITEAYNDFRAELEKLDEENPYKSHAHGQAAFEGYNKWVKNIDTHFKHNLKSLQFLDERAEPLRETAEEEYTDFLENLETALETHTKIYEQFSQEIYDENGEYDRESILQKSTPVDVVNGRVASELEQFIDEAIPAYQEARKDANQLTQQYGEIVDQIIHENYRTETPEETETPEKIDKPVEFSERIRETTQKIEDSTQELRETLGETA